MLSLPLAFKTELHSIPATVPYLRCDPTKQHIWQQRLGSVRQKRIGLVWAGGKAYKNDHNRSLAVALLAPLFDLPLQFHVLQQDISPQDRAFLVDYPQLHCHTENLQDFTDTAALIAEMDLVISVDTSVAHLTGALAKPLWLLLPYAADFRWLLNRTTALVPNCQAIQTNSAGRLVGVMAELGWLCSLWL